MDNQCIIWYNINCIFIEAVSLGSRMYSFSYFESQRRHRCLCETLKIHRNTLVCTVICEFWNCIYKIGNDNKNNEIFWQIWIKKALDIYGELFSMCRTHHNGSIESKVEVKEDIENFCCFSFVFFVVLQSKKVHACTHCLCCIVFVCEY